MNDVKGRLYSYIEHKGITVRDFERGASLSNGYVSSIRKSIGANSLDKILEQYTDINRDWLLYGEGEMLVEDKKTMESNAKMIDTSIVMVPMVPYGARAGSALGYADLFEEEKNMQYPVFIKPGEKIEMTSRVFHVEGDSMVQQFFDGDMVLAKYLDPSYYKDYRLNLRRHPYWVILTKDGVVVKNISEHNVADGTITCHSINPAYEDFSIHLSEVFQLYYIDRLVGRNY